MAPGLPTQSGTLWDGIYLGTKWQKKRKKKVTEVLLTLVRQQKSLVPFLPLTDVHTATIFRKIEFLQ